MHKLEAHKKSALKCIGGLLGILASKGVIVLKIDAIEKNQSNFWILPAQLLITTVGPKSTKMLLPSVIVLIIS